VETTPADRRSLAAFGGAVRRARERQRISQEDLAFEAGLDRTYISGVERGRRNPTVVSIRKIALALGTKPSLLFAAAERKLGGA
jgi:transcriptional regulator with XRE-family HTH domain